MMALTLFLLGSGNPKQAFLGVVVTALGFPVYQFLFRSKRLVERRTTQ
jgi:multisubunit Na+/H+ antiporter MnhB subunit